MTSAVESTENAVDYHHRCGSYAAITAEDAHGPHGHILTEVTHPAYLVYPDLPVVSCDLAAGHGDRCEFFVDSTGPGLQHPGEPVEVHWIAWQRRDYFDGPQTAYEWIVSTESCETTSPHNYICSRPARHAGGHSFTVRN